MDLRRLAQNALDEETPGVVVGAAEGTVFDLGRNALEPQRRLFAQAGCNGSRSLEIHMRSLLRPEVTRGRREMLGDRRQEVVDELDLRPRREQQVAIGAIARVRRI